MIVGPVEYATAVGEARRQAQEQFVSWWWAGIADAEDFADLFSRADALAMELAAIGYAARLLDEDTETTVVYGARVNDLEAATVHASWDREEGPSVSCLFSGPAGTITLAKGRDGQIVEL